MTKTQEARSMPSAVSRLRVSPPSKPTTLAVAVSLAMGATPAFAQWGNQVEAWIKGGTDRSYGGVEGLLPLTQDGNSLLFGDLKFKLGQQGSYEGNIGLGYRFLTQGNWAIGLYGGYDYRNSDNDNAFHQVSAGVEARSDSLDFRFNYYYPLSDEEYLKPGDNYDFGNFSIYRSGMYEEAMEGFDIEAGVLLPISDKWETRAYAAYYDFESDATDVDLNGWRVRVETRPMQNLAIGLSYQDDDYFDSQAALEVRYIFGKDAKPGIRKIRERMTDPWVKDIDIVVTGEEELRGKKYGKAVPDLDVVHINSAYDGSNGSSDGSFERPYTSVADCETAGGDNGKCHQDDNLDTYGDYNVIRMWEGDSQTGGMEYTPITLFNGQMLAGEPITARNIVNLHQQGFWTGTFDPIDYDVMPVISGTAGGGTGTAVYLASDVSVLGVATVSGGMMGTNVGGYIDIRYNDISNYYTGVGIGIDNTNVANSEINITYNSIAASGTGISLSNTATAGNASYMAAYIVGNQIRADGDSSATGIAITNLAQPNAFAEQFNLIAGNSIAAYSVDATGVSISNAANGSTYYSAVAEQYNIIWSNGYDGGSGIYASGSNSAVGVAISNSTYYGHAGQINGIKYNSITAYGGWDATGVQISNLANVFGYASQTNLLDGNSILAHDFYGISSATGVSLTNNAAKYGLAVQRNTLDYNSITAISEYGNATGVYASNRAGGKYYGGTSVAYQSLGIYGGSISATAANGYYANYGTAVGLDLRNEAGAKYYSSAEATQLVGLSDVGVNATGASAYGVRAFNGNIPNINSGYPKYITTSYSGGTMNASQNLFIYDSSISATSWGDGGMGPKDLLGPGQAGARGISMENRANYAGSTASQTLAMEDSTVTALTSGEGASSVGLDMFNWAVGGSTATQGAIAYGSSISATAQQDGWSTGVRMFNQANAFDYYTTGTSAATQNLAMFGSSVFATSNDMSAYGIDAFNDGESRYYGNVANATQTLNLNGVDVHATATQGRATGVWMGNDGDSRYYSQTSVTQGLTFTYGSITASGFDGASGLEAWSDSEAYHGRTDASQTITLSNPNAYLYGSFNVTATTANGNAFGVRLSNDVDARAQYYNGGGSAYAIGTQTVTLYDAIISATSTSGVADGLAVSNSAYADGYWDTATAQANSTVNVAYSTITATGGGAFANGLSARNSAEVKYGGTSTATQTLNIGYGSITASASNGNAWGVNVNNAAEISLDGGSATATQNVSLTDMTVTATARYYATGIEANNHATKYGYNGGDAAATQTLALGSSSVSATSTYYDAIGMSLRNSSFNDGYDMVSALQTVTLDDTSVTATASDGSAVGIYAMNESYGLIYNTSFATQLVTLGNGSSVTASGVFAGGIIAGNEVKYAADGTSTQTIALANASVTATGTGTGPGKYSVGIGAANVNESYAGIATQTVTAAASTITASGYNGTGVYAITYGDTGPFGVTAQTVTLASNNITADMYGSTLIAAGNTYQVGTVTGNTVNAYGGVFMYADASAAQIVTVSGNTFNTANETIYAGGGLCVGPQCVP